MDLGGERRTLIAGVATESRAGNRVHSAATDLAEPGTRSHAEVPGGGYPDAFRVRQCGGGGEAALSVEDAAAIAGHRRERAGGAHLEYAVVVALREVEVAGGVESHAVRREEVHRGGRLADR